MPEKNLSALRQKILRFRSRRSSSGYTLVETLMTVLLASLIFGACLLVLLSGNDYWQTNSTKIAVQQEIRKAMDWMKEDLAAAGPATITNVPADGAWYTSISFMKSSGVSAGAITWSPIIQFALSGTRVNKTQSAVTKILAQDINSLRFRRQSATPGLLEISIQGRKNTLRGAQISSTITYKVKLMN